jgi:adenylate cyclase
MELGLPLLSVEMKNLRMKLRGQTRLRFKILLSIGLISGMIGALYVGLTRSIKPIDLFHGFFVGVGVSLSIAASEMFFLRAWMKRRSFTTSVLVRTTYFLLAIISVLLMASVLFGKEGFETQNFGQLWGHPIAYNDILFSFLVSFLFSLFLQINGLIGARILLSFFTGKYHQPIEEDRIFMFLDLKSSTTIAEKIGHINFHKFINDFLFTISEAIISSKGEIYKYVGDEVIITWKLKEGLKGGNCIRLFFEALDRIKQERGKFEKKYGMVPEFKAGIHCGKVVAGEMGDTKKEVAFLGDVINTAARIEDECNPRRRRLLISDDLLQKTGRGKEYRYERIGEINLRGKVEKIDLYAVERNSTQDLPSETSP